MLSLFKKQTQSNQTKDDLIVSILSLENHHWIVQDTIYSKFFSRFLNYLRKSTLLMISHQKIVFVRTNAMLSCTVQVNDNNPVILIFPDLNRIIQSALPSQAMAILAHELGHIKNQHSIRNIDPLQTQVEADHFAFEEGFGRELSDVISNGPQNEESRVRLTYLTANLFTQGNLTEN